MKLTKEILNEIIDDISMLDIDADKIIITGSVALCAYGLKEEFNDVDVILINPSKSCHRELLSNYEEGGGDYEKVCVHKKQWDIDIFIERFADEYPIIEIADGFWLSTLDCIINAKRRLDREKDRSDFEGMVSALSGMCGLNKKEKPFPRVMLVSNGGNEWHKRVVFMQKCDRFLAWNNAETIEDAERTYRVASWHYAKELPEKVELTKSEIAEKFGISIDQLVIKDD